MLLELAGNEAQHGMLKACRSAGDAFYAMSMLSRCTSRIMHIYIVMRPSLLLIYFFLSDFYVNFCLFVMHIVRLC